MKIWSNSLIQFVKRSKETILLIIVVSAMTLLISTIVFAWLNIFHNLSFPSLGTIQVVGTDAYGGDINYTENGIPYIDWGTVYPGTFTTRSFYLISKSTTPITLSLKISNVTFQNSNGQNVTENLPIENPLNLTWNYNNTLLGPNEEIYVTLTLKVSSDKNFLDYLIAYDVKNFSFDIVVTPSVPIKSL